MCDTTHNYYVVIFGYSDTPHKLIELRLNHIDYEFVYDDSYFKYEGSVIIGIPKPQLKWQRKVVDRLCQKIRQGKL